MHGPPASYTGDLYKAVDWPPTIPVLDTVVTSLGARDKLRWRRLRREALDKWARAGFTFEVIPGHAANYPAYDPTEPDEYTRLMAPIVSNHLRLMHLPVGAYYDKYGGAMYAHPGAWAGFDMDVFWNLGSRTRQYALAHEIGHCFGLAHRQFEDTVMWQGLEPDAHDLDSLRSYYGNA